MVSPELEYGVPETPSVLSLGFWPSPTVKASFQLLCAQIQVEHRGMGGGTIRLVSRCHLTFRTSALDYPRISFGAKLRGAVRYRRSSARWLDAVTERQLP